MGALGWPGGIYAFKGLLMLAAACQWPTGAHRWTDDKDKVSEDTTAAIQGTLPGV